mgnify:CR=1 FL=1
MALTEAELITPGSGYGAFRKEYARTGQFEICKENGKYGKVGTFF